MRPLFAYFCFYNLSKDFKEPDTIKILSLTPIKKTVKVFLFYLLDQIPVFLDSLRCFGLLKIVVTLQLSQGYTVRSCGQP